MPAFAPFVFLAVVVGLIVAHLVKPSSRTCVWKALAGISIFMFVTGAWIGLVWAPPETMMGDVQRIMYMHVPQVWMALMALTLNFGCAIAYLMKKSWVTDSLAEASAEVGVFFGTVGVVLGAIWGKPTWGVYWDWDPRLTTAAIMIVIYSGYLAFRKLVEDPEKRATWSAVMAIIAAVDLPILWFSVKWWKSLHQVQSTPKTVDPAMALALRWSTIAFLAIGMVFLWQRYLIAKAEREAELTEPELPQGAPEAV